MLSQAVPFPLFMETSGREQAVKEYNPNVTGFVINPHGLRFTPRLCTSIRVALSFFQVALALKGPKAESCAVRSEASGEQEGPEHTCKQTPVMKLCFL